MRAPSWLSMAEALGRGRPQQPPPLDVGWGYRHGWCAIRVVPPPPPPPNPPRLSGGQPPPTRPTPRSKLTASHRFAAARNDRTGGAAAACELVGRPLACKSFHPVRGSVTVSLGGAERAFVARGGRSDEARRLARAVDWGVKVRCAVIQHPHWRAARRAVRARSRSAVTVRLVASTVTVSARSRSAHGHGLCTVTVTVGVRSDRAGPPNGHGTRGQAPGGRVSVTNAEAPLDTGCRSSWWEGRGPRGPTSESSMGPARIAHHPALMGGEGPRGPASSSRAGRAALQRESGPGPWKTRMARQDSGGRSGIQRPTPRRRCRERRRPGTARTRIQRCGPPPCGLLRAGTAPASLRLPGDSE